MRKTEAEALKERTTLGLISNQIWYDDPGRLSAFLARYNFIAETVSGGQNVAEVGGGDAFAARIVSLCVEQLTIYHNEPEFIRALRSQHHGEGTPPRVRLHDILVDVLPERHDRIFSLDVLENVLRFDEDVYLTNLRNSLTDNGVLVIGISSPGVHNGQLHDNGERESNCKTGPELQNLLRRYFGNVVLASMDGETVYHGAHSGAEYSFVICS